MPWLAVREARKTYDSLGRSAAETGVLLSGVREAVAVGREQIFVHTDTLVDGLIG